MWSSMLWIRWRIIMSPLSRWGLCFAWWRTYNGIKRRWLLLNLLYWWTFPRSLCETWLPTYLPFRMYNEQSQAEMVRRAYFLFIYGLPHLQKRDFCSILCRDRKWTTRLKKTKRKSSLKGDRKSKNRRSRQRGATEKSRWCLL